MQIAEQFQRTMLVPDSELRQRAHASAQPCIQQLAISGCCELEELPSLARLSALERFTADKCWKLQNTGGVEQLERLKDFRFLADNGAVWNCFHDLQVIN